MTAPKIVVLGMMTKIPVGGPVWLAAHYLVGLRRLGFDVYYVEAHGRTPSMLMENADDDPNLRAAAFIDRQLRRFGLADKWAFHALHDDDRCFGLSRSQLSALYRDAALIVNLHGGTVPTEEHAASGRLVYIGTDPVDVELEVAAGDRAAIEYLEPHVAFFTWGLNHGRRTCRLPYDERFPFVPSPPPVLLDEWHNTVHPDAVAPITTIGNWRQHGRVVEVDGERYTWTKHEEFMKVLDLPGRTGQPFELALSSYEPEDEALLRRKGWAVRPGYEMSRDVDGYRAYIVASAAEFSVAKDQNVRLRTGWFSERSAMYLAAGRPVILQDTGFGEVLPTGDGLLDFTDEDSAVDAVDAIRARPEHHRRAARDLAREYFDADVVLTGILRHAGVHIPARHTRRIGLGAAPLPLDASIVPERRAPLRLPAATVEAVLAAPVPRAATAPGRPRASVVMVTHDNLLFTRMAVESVLAEADVPLELVVVDNASTDGTVDYLGTLASRNAHVRVVRNDRNVGFAAANNQGVAASEGEVVVLLNNDVIVTPGWLRGLTRHLTDGPALVGPVTNRCGNEAEIPATYTSYRDLLRFARGVTARAGDSHFEPPMLTMFCVAGLRSTFDRIGPLDETFGVGMFEDDDYSRRARKLGIELRCAEGVFVHHFGQATFGKLIPSGEYMALHDANRRRFETKWHEAWMPHDRRVEPSYEQLRADVRADIARQVPPGAVVLVVSRGDDELLDVPGRTAWHFPRLDDGSYAGHHPADDAEAIGHLQRLQHEGARFLVLPRTSSWWLDHYAGFAAHLENNHARLSADDDASVVFALAGSSPAGDQR